MPFEGEKGRYGKIQREQRRNLSLRLDKKTGRRPDVEIRRYLQKYVNKIDKNILGKKSIAFLLVPARC